MLYRIRNLGLEIVGARACRCLYGLRYLFLFFASSKKGVSGFCCAWFFIGVLDWDGSRDGSLLFE